MSNLDIRQAVKDSGLKLWQIAAELGLNDGNFSRKLRQELSVEEKGNIFAIIARLDRKKEADHERD